MGLSYAKIADKLSKKLGEYEDILEGKPGSSTEPTEINAAKLKIPQIKQALQELEESQKVEVKVKELVDQGVPKDEARQVVIQQMQQEQMQMQQQQQQMQQQGQQQAPQGGQPQPQGMPMDQGMSPYQSGGKLPMYQGYDSRIQPGSYDPNTGQLSYRQNPVRSWDTPDEPSMGDIPMNSPNVNPNTSTVPNMFMGYEQMGYAQEGGSLPFYQANWKDIAAMAPAVIGGIAALTNRGEPDSENPYKDFNPYGDMGRYPTNQPKSKTTGMDIPTAMSLGFTQSYPSLYAQKGGNLPEYQMRKDPISGADARALLSDRRTANAFHQDLVTSYGERDLASGAGYTPAEASKLGGYDNYLTAMGSLQSKNPTLNTDTSGPIEGQLPLAKQIIGDRQLNYRGLEFPSVKNMPPLTKQKGGKLPEYQAKDKNIGEYTMEDLRGTEMLSALDEPGQYQIDFVDYINTGKGGKKLGPGLGKAEAMRQFHLRNRQKEPDFIDYSDYSPFFPNQTNTPDTTKILPSFQEDGDLNEEEGIPWGDISQGVLGAVGTAPIWHNIKQSKEPIDYYEGFANPYMGQMQASLGEMGRLTGEAETALKTPRFYDPRSELVAAQRRKEGAMQAASDASGGSARFALQNRARAKEASEYDQILTKAQNINTQWNDPKAKAQGLMGLAGAYGQQGRLGYGMGKDIGAERWKVFDWAQRAEAARRGYGTQAAMDLSEWAQTQQQMGNQRAMDQLSVEQQSYLADNFDWKKVDGKWTLVPKP